MNKSELINAIAEQAGLTKVDAKKAKQRNDVQLQALQGLL